MTKHPSPQERLTLWVEQQPTVTSAAATLEITTETLRQLMRGSTPSLRVAVRLEVIAGIAPRDWHNG